MTGDITTTPYKDRLMPTTTASQARLQFFQPTRNPTYCTRKIETAWGRAEITGKLGVMHAALLELIMFHAIRRRDLEDWSIQVLVDPYHLRKGLGEGERHSRDKVTKLGNGRRAAAWGGYSSTAIWTLIQDLKSASILLTNRQGGEWVFDGLLYRVEASKILTTPTDLTIEHEAKRRLERHRLWRVTLSPTTARLYGEDIPRHYDPRPVAALRSGVAAAVARWVLTHTKSPQGGGWRIDTVLEAVGAETEGVPGRHRRSELRRAAPGLAAAGVIVDGDRVRKDGGVHSTPTCVHSTPTKPGSV